MFRIVNFLSISKIMGFSNFVLLQNNLSPGGSLLSRLLRGPIVFNLCFIGVGNVYWTFFSLWGNGLF